MSSIQPTPDNAGTPLDRAQPDLRHPHWCAGEPVCTAFTDPLSNFHRSAPARIEAERYGELDITAEARSSSDGPIESEPVTLLLTFDTGGLVPHRCAYELEARQAAALAEALQPLVAILARQSAAANPGR